MLKRSLYIIISMMLVFTTTTSIWSHLLEDDDDDAIEISNEKETDGEEVEKETEREFREFDGLSDGILSSSFNIVPQIYCGLQKIGSSTFAPAERKSGKLYLIYEDLKLDC